MLQECLEVFEEEWNKKGERLILDSYIPADGTYLIIDSDGNRKAMVDIKLDKKTKMVDRSNLYYPDICFYDYHSQLVSIDKPVDGKKIIHSNNYLSFAVKKENIISKKLTDEIIDGYYEVLKNPVKCKYKNSKKSSEIYMTFEKSEGKIDEEEVEKKKQWVKKNIFLLEGVDMERKDYLKIFFEADNEVYKREEKRYLLPNIYNNNDYNIKIEDRVYGLPGNNLGMNTKKPYLSIKSRKYPTSYLLDGDKVILQKKFFDYLMNLVSAGKYHVYVDTEQRTIVGYKNGDTPESIQSGYYLRLKKGKTEAEIWMQDNISEYKDKLKDGFDFDNIIGANHEKKSNYWEWYRRYDKRSDINKLINEVFFLKWLSENYMTDPVDINIKDETLKKCILFSRDTIFDWIYKGRDIGIERVLEKVSLELIKGSLLKGYRERALLQLNLKWSFREYFSEKGENNMAEIITNLRENMERRLNANITIPLENDTEYYYAVGQLVYYLISLSKAGKLNESLLNPFMNAKTDEVIKKRILQMYKKYNYSIIYNAKRINKLLTLVEGYIPEGKVNQEMILLGYATDNLIYMKEEK